MIERFPFQNDGARFLAEHMRGLLADEQGLGKTVQAIDAADTIGAERILVTCKAVAKINWEREFYKWSEISPLARPVLIPRPGMQIPKTKEGPCVCVINYDILHRPEILGQLVRRRWDVLIADEMQMLKSGIGSRRGQALLHPFLGIHKTANYVWGLSGTPAPSHAGELYPWLAALHPEIMFELGITNYQQFLARFTYFEETPYGPRILGNRDAASLREILKPIMLRRRRKQVLPQLPPLVVDSIAIEGKDLPELNALERHPDVQTVRKVIEALRPEENPEAFLETADMPWSSMRRLIGLAKVEAVAELVAEELENSTDKIVVMCWHTDVIDTLVSLLGLHGAVGLHGKMSDTQKQFAIDAFQDRPEYRVFVGQIQAAGTSITLTAGNRMFFAEYSTVPGENEQALLRIMRIGQQRGCRASFVGLADSLDDIVTRIYARKAQMLDEFLN